MLSHRHVNLSGCLYLVVSDTLLITDLIYSCLCWFKAKTEQNQAGQELDACSADGH